MKSTYRLAGHAIKIESLYSQVHTLCAAYRVEDDAEYCITTTPADIAYERKRSARADELEGVAVREYANPYLETLAVYRKLAQLLVQDDILLMHGAVVVDGQAYLFTARSGTGKTTHTRLWMQQFGDRAVMVNGDKPLLHVTNTGVTVYGTPWDGKEHLQHATLACPLKAVCILTRSETNHIERISPKRRHLPMLCQQSYRPAQPAAVDEKPLHWSICWAAACRCTSWAATWNRRLHLWLTTG